MLGRLIRIKNELKKIKGELIEKHNHTKNYNIKLKAMLTLIDFIDLVIALMKEE